MISTFRRWGRFVLALVWNMLPSKFEISLDWPLSLCAQFAFNLQLAANRSGAQPGHVALIPVQLHTFRPVQTRGGHPVIQIPFYAYRDATCERNGSPCTQVHVRLPALCPTFNTDPPKPHTNCDILIHVFARSSFPFRSPASLASIYLSLYPPGRVCAR